MDVKRAVQLSKNHLLELFSEEEIENLGLEEIEFDEGTNEWLVTLGFSRPWENRGAVATLLQPSRTYKVVRIHDSGEVRAVKNRESSH